MHEQSVMRAILDHVREVCREKGISRVREIHVQVGEFSGVEPLLLAQAFKLSTLEPLLAGARLHIESVPMALRCETCEAEQQPRTFDFHCPACGGRMRVVRGGEVTLAHLVVDGDGGCAKPSRPSKRSSQLQAHKE